MASQPPPLLRNPIQLGAEPPPDLSVLECAPLDPHHLHEREPEVVALYLQWSSTRPAPPPYNPAAALPTVASALAGSRDAWTIKAAAAWVLSRQLGDHSFELYALAQLIRHCGVALFGPWAFIEARCPVGSSIRRFANHWVAWNASFSAAGSPSEFAGLHAATLVNQVVRGETHDPRTFALEHWFQPCGDDLAAKCDHNPAVRRAKERERLRPAPPKPSRLGRVDELKLQTRAGPTKGAYWKFKRRIVFSVLFLLNLIITGIIVGLQLGQVLLYTPGLRVSNVRFSAFVVVVGLGQFIFSFCGWRPWFAGYGVVFILMAFANGVTWAIDTKSCIHFLNVGQCSHITSSTAFVLLCILFSAMHLIAVRTSS
ncbi:hypothetical protein B0H67DRAFT_606636 [Lasiosphaeris hirsuta]|uniref:Uncharacterized protein n=1 Tax=Lasiosphaeris hirsuta TaxID=260670 RepID=A0AA40E9U1_9PEZI|nr:hypothetical protein B0H67DRAFT_606636 [Lasiosphaeris hirsuta]